MDEIVDKGVFCEELYVKLKYRPPNDSSVFQAKVVATKEEVDWLHCYVTAVRKILLATGRSRALEGSSMVNKATFLKFSGCAFLVLPFMYSRGETWYCFEKQQLSGTFYLAELLFQVRDSDTFGLTFLLHLGIWQF